MVLNPAETSVWRRDGCKGSVITSCRGAFMPLVHADHIVGYTSRSADIDSAVQYVWNLVSDHSCAGGLPCIDQDVALETHFT